MDPNKVRLLKEEAMKHLEFCCDLYKIQVASNRYFLHEHPWSAHSWNTQCIRELHKLKGVSAIRGDMCRFGMKQSDNLGVGRIYKPTGWCSNSPEIRAQMHKLSLAIIGI